MSRAKKVLSPYGKLLRKLRIDNDDSGVLLADKVGVKGVVVSQIERGRCKIPKGFTAKVAELYKLTQEQIDELIKAEEHQLLVVQLALDACDTESYDILVNLSKKIAESSKITKDVLKNIVDGVFA